MKQEINNDLLLKKISSDSCISLIGMPSVGKSTVGFMLAEEINFAHLDSDYVIESLYGVNLQQITDSLTKEKFLDLEGEVISKLLVKRTVISTGGSVVYRDWAMEKLKALGPCVFLSTSLDIILERLALHPDRGIAIGPNQTIEDLFNERMALYTKYADFTVNVSRETTPKQVVQAIINNYK